MAAVTAFRKEFFATDNVTVYDSYQARLLRYQLGQAYYDNTAYSSIHSWVDGYKVQNGLYKYIRPIYNPATKLVDFYGSIVWPGLLDSEAGNKGAIPIEVKDTADEDSLRKAISQVWLNSNWREGKDIHVMRGSMLGDAAIYIRDDPSRGDVSLEVLHPSVIKEVDIDRRGFVRSYTLEESRLFEGKAFTYTEKVEHGEGEEIIFRTYRNNAPFAWPENTDANGVAQAEWSEMYGFIPLVLTRHINIGSDWGLSAYGNYMPKFAQLDDIASKLYDQIRKAVESPGIVFGATAPSTAPTMTTKTATTDRPQPGREQSNLIYISTPGASFQSMVSNLDIAAVSAEIQNFLTQLETELPELNDDVWGGDARVEGVKAARAKVERKVTGVRSRYDSSIVYANQMAIAIGGFRGYEGFEGYNLDSYKAGKLAHSVADRPVFPIDEATRIANETTIWTTAATVARDSQGQIPVEAVLLALGKKEEDLKDLPTQRMAAIRLQQEDTIPRDGL